MIKEKISGNKIAKFGLEENVIPKKLDAASINQIFALILTKYTTSNIELCHPKYFDLINFWGKKI